MLILAARPPETPAEPDDELASVLLRAGAGDQAAWEDLVGRYARRIFALAHSRCHDADMADEITQSVFVTVAQKLGSGQYTERGRFESWLFRVAMNRLRDEIRRIRRHASPTEPRTFSALPAADRADEVEDLGALRRAMDHLSRADREVVELRHHGQLTFRQMAELTGEPLGTLLARHHRALRKLRELIEQSADLPAATETES
jgi:RNA polymerase sigma-70 factor (ECF subfamily)